MIVTLVAQEPYAKRLAAFLRQIEINVYIMDKKDFIFYIDILLMIIACLLPKAQFNEFYDDKPNLSIVYALAYIIIFSIFVLLGIYLKELGNYIRLGARMLFSSLIILWIILKYIYG
jgi:hypothetical protein